MAAAHDDSSPLSPERLDPGSNVLIAGPALTGKRGLMLDLVAGSPDRTAILVTTKQSAARIQADLGERCDVRIVDCVTRQRAVGPVRETETVRYLGSPADLTGVGIATSGFMQELYHAPGRPAARLGLHSLSTLLMYADLRRVYQFLHVIAGRVASSDFSGAYTLDTLGRDEETIDRLKSLFDAMVEVREDPRQLRVRGGDFGPSGWTAF